MSNQLSTSLEFFIVVFGELAVLFIAISFVVSLINQKLPPEKIKRLLSGNRGYGIAVGLGAVTPFCSCSTLPMTIGLIQARAAFGPIMAFLFTSPLLNPFIVGLFWISFGAKITLIYSVFVVSLAMLSGALLQKFKFDRFIRVDILKNTSATTCADKSALSSTECVATKSVATESIATESTNNERACTQSKCSTPDLISSTNDLNWKKLFIETIQQFKSFAPYMVLGVAVGAVLHGYVPESAFESLAGQNIFILIPLSAIVGVFLYVRASTMVPIATSLAAKGMAMGAVMSLTIAGAGASLPEMIMMKKMFHWPLLTAFIFVVFATACITGFAIELL
ncbi:MAG: permease [Colwellia sp.]|nr:permease [Colwellia sp.]